MIYGYARVSTGGQSIDSHVRQLTNAGCKKVVPKVARQDGRKPELTQHPRREAMKRCDGGEPVRGIARSFNVHHATISRLGA